MIFQFSVETEVQIKRVKMSAIIPHIISYLVPRMRYICHYIQRHVNT